MNATLKANPSNPTPSRPRWMPQLPEGTAQTLQSKMNRAVETVAVEKVDTLACGGVDQLVEKIPALKEATPELIKNTKVKS